MNTRPFIVEFTGTPEAGKTTCIKSILCSLAEFLDAKICFIQESAELLPSKIPKGGISADLLMFSITLYKLLEGIYDESNDIIIIDRGIFDKCFFGYRFYNEHICSAEQYSFYKSLPFFSLLSPDLVIHLSSCPEESIRRRGGEGRLVTFEWVKRYNFWFDKFVSEHLEDFSNMSFFSLDTTHLSKSEVAQITSNRIISAYNEHKNTSV